VTEFPRVVLPRMLPIRQEFPSDRIDDVEAAVRSAVQSQGALGRLPRGASVAITAGSRGIADIPLVIRTVASCVREVGAKPFIVPAMGSHGGATAGGQEEVLAHYGITEESVGAPIRASMDTVQLGTTETGATVYMDRLASEADATIVVARVKPHTSFRADIESGLCKMLSIGLGKQRGAQSIHSVGLAQTIPQSAQVTIERGNLLMGVGLVENAFHQLHTVRACAPGEFHATDRELLAVAKTLLPRVAFDHLHVLGVGWIGKNISGSGMDYNVVGMWRRIGGDRVPDYERIAVFDVTDESDGNAFGLGIADFATQRLVDKMVPQKTYMNALTAGGGAIGAVKIPITVPTDRDALEIALASVGKIGAPRIALIRNTLELQHVWVSEALMDEVAAHPHMRVLGDPRDDLFGAAGNLNVWERVPVNA
jgi:hypothetical protein